jgi:hypothetical protein
VRAVQEESEGSTSFLKKRSKRLLCLRASDLSGHGLDVPVGTRSKSLLLLFFRKEDLSFSHPRDLPFLRAHTSILPAHSIPRASGPAERRWTTCYRNS